MPVTSPGRAAGAITRALEELASREAVADEREGAEGADDAGHRGGGGGEPEAQPERRATKSGYSPRSRYQRSDSRRGGNWRKAASPKDTTITTRMGASRNA